MATNICSACFSVSDFSAGASALTAAVQGGYCISGYVLPVAGETPGGSVNVEVQFFQGEKALGERVSLNIADTTPPGNSVEVPGNATMAVMTFAKSTMPMCTVVLSVSTS
jgi:hypothetical protein